MKIQFKIYQIFFRNEWESMNVHQKTRIKDQINKDVFLEIRLHFKGAIKQFQHATIKYQVHSDRQVDESDALVEMQAVITNAIKYTGIIKDDSPLYLDEVSIGWVRDNERFVDVELEVYDD